MRSNLSRRQRPPYTATSSISPTYPSTYPSPINNGNDESDAATDTAALRIQNPIDIPRHRPAAVSRVTTTWDHSPNTNDADVENP